MSANQVLKNAIAEIGYKEGQNNDNKYAAMAGHANHQAWCATFVYAMFKKAGEEKAIPNTAYCPYIEAWGKQHNRVVPMAEAKKGDLVLFDFARKGIADHVGILNYDYDPTRPNLIRTIEGNTGSQSETNGDGVAAKNRASSLVRVIVRPNWSK